MVTKKLRHFEGTCQHQKITFGGYTMQLIKSQINLLFYV